MLRVGDSGHQGLARALNEACCYSTAVNIGTTQGVGFLYYCSSWWVATVMQDAGSKLGVWLLQWLEIKETDDEKTKAKKKKLQKSHKSKQRFARLDAETQQRQQSWQNFKKGKGSQKKVRPWSGWACLPHPVVRCC